MFVPHCPSPRHQGQAPTIEPGELVQASPLAVTGYAGVSPALVINTTNYGDIRRFLLWWFAMGAPALGTSVQTVPVCELRRTGGRAALGAQARTHLARLTDDGDCSPDMRATIRAVLA